MSSVRLIGGVALALLSVGPAGAQDQPFEFPNPLQGGNVAATCNNWEAQQAAGDPQAMRMVSGVWDGQGMLPGVPGLYPDTPVQSRSSFNPNGAFEIQQYACFQMQSVPGMPAMPPSCATSMVYGEWTAHGAPDGSVMIVTLSSGSGFSGQALPMSCGAGPVRLPDPNTMIGSDGSVSRRVG